MVSISGLQVALLERDINSEVLFCRRTVKIEDVLKTMNRVVLSDSVSVRGVDKAVVVGPDDEIILYQRKGKPGEQIDDENEEEGGVSGQQTATGDQQVPMETGEGDADDEVDDDDDDDFELDYWRRRKPPRNKDMILDLFTDAPKHAVLFHFAEDDFQYEPWDP
nr:hypothetical protein BaRGS_004550 [Batillaria attramentaria]